LKGIFHPHAIRQWNVQEMHLPKILSSKIVWEKREIEYRTKPMNVLDDEKRCKICGTLFERHSEMNHSFQD